MKKVYQKIIDPKRGDCMQAVFASLFEKKLDEVPKFIELGDEWYSEMRKYSKSNGYIMSGNLYNKKYNRLCYPTASCWRKEKWDNKQMLTKHNLSKHSGVNGLFYAGVFSPKFFNLGDGFFNQHAVIINKNMEIVHDPNPNYMGILNYPLSQVIGCNGILDVYLFEPLK